MTTPIVQNKIDTPVREKVPPPEHRQAEGEDQTDSARQTAEVVTRDFTPPTPLPKEHNPDNQPGGLAKSMAHWVHRHPEAHKRGVGNVVYQYLRSFAASVPYGLSMASVLALFTGMERWGSGLAKDGASSFSKGFGRTLEGFSKFGPARSAALIGASFTLYRGTSKLSKWLTEYVFNPKDSEQRTAEKIHDLPNEIGRKIKEIGPAEASSTPVSAIVLGFIVSAFQAPFGKDKPPLVVETAKGVSKNIEWTRANFLNTKGLGEKLKLMGSVIAHPKAKFIPQAAINTFGYALFFELGDRLFKDTQIRRGVWPGEHHSIKALKAAPDEYAQGIQNGNQPSAVPKYEDSAAEAKQEKKHYGFFTSEPSVGRFLFRRVLPTAVGITAYTGAKMRWATMLGNDFSYKAGEGLLHKIPKLALGEGLATSLFFLIPIVSEPWEKAYDNFFAKKEKVAQLKDRMRKYPEIITLPLTSHQAQKYEALLARVNAKEQGAAISA